MHPIMVPESESNLVVYGLSEPGHPEELRYVGKTKNLVAPNKGKTGQIAWNKGIKTGKPAWNKGLPMGAPPNKGQRLLIVEGKNTYVSHDDPRLIGAPPIPGISRPSPNKGKTLATIGGKPTMVFPNDPRLKK